MSSMGLTWARQAEVLRSDEKDRQHIDSVRRDIFEGLSELLGLRHIVRHYQVLATVNSVIYYTLTTLRDRQTLGEQYVNMVRCNPEGRPNTLFQRIMLVLEQLPWKQFLASGNPDRQQVISVICQLHLIHFYLFGEYSTIGRRLSRSRYALLRSFLDMPQLEWTFRIIGLLYTVKLLRDLLQSTKSMLEPAKSTSIDSDASGQRHVDAEQQAKPENRRLQCGLCRDATVECTATRCGHIFCWACITQWAAKKFQCPLCRSSIFPEQLVRVLNR